MFAGCVSVHVLCISACMSVLVKVHFGFFLHSQEDTRKGTYTTTAIFLTIISGNT